MEITLEELYAVIGELEMTRRKLIAENQRLQKELEELKRDDHTKH